MSKPGYTKLGDTDAGTALQAGHWQGFSACMLVCDVNDRGNATSVHIFEKKNPNL